MKIAGDKPEGAIAFMVHTDEFYIPMEESIDPAAECERLKKEREYLEGFLRSVNAKLNNQKFMSNAKPEVVDNELKKKADAETKLKAIGENIASLAC